MKRTYFKWTDEKVIEGIQFLMKKMKIERLPSFPEINNQTEIEINQKITTGYSLSNAIALRGGNRYFSELLSIPIKR